MNTIISSDFSFPNQNSVYKGKVRDVYTIEKELLVMIATDRLSAFDVVLPKGIPYKGQILNQIASEFLQKTQDIVPNWLIATPDPNVSVGIRCEPFKVEMVIRGYLAGHAAREYKAGKRELCDVPLPEGLRENDPLPNPIITPTSKADNGAHDEDISKEEILKRNIVSKEDYAILEKYTYALSKEFVRQWLISKGFQGKAGQQIPEMTPEYIASVSDRYIELYEHLLGKEFIKADISNIQERIYHNVTEYFNSLL